MEYPGKAYKECDLLPGDVISTSGIRCLVLQPGTCNPDECILVLVENHGIVSTITSAAVAAYYVVEKKSRKETNECKHEYIPMFTFFACRFCGKEK